MKSLPLLITLTCVFAVAIAGAEEKPAGKAPDAVETSAVEVGELVDIAMIPAIWHHGLNSTTLTGYAKGEHLIISDMWTGSRGSDAVIRHSLQVKVSAWDQAFATNWASDDQRQRESLTVTLHESPNAGEMVAEFDHAAYEDGRLVLRFSGTTMLVRVN